MDSDEKATVCECDHLTAFALVTRSRGAQALLPPSDQQQVSVTRDDGTAVGKVGGVMSVELVVALLVLAVIVIVALVLLQVIDQPKHSPLTCISR